jgi:PAS domain-containing protein
MDRFRCLAESSPDGILIVEGERVTFANAAAAVLFAASAGTALGASLFDLVECVEQGEDGLRARVAWRQAGRMAPAIDARIAALGVRHVRVAGAPADARTVVDPVDPAGRHE